jgi:hypothetical protein
MVGTGKPHFYVNFFFHDIINYIFYGELNKMLVDSLSILVKTFSIANKNLEQE